MIETATRGGNSLYLGIQCKTAEMRDLVRTAVFFKKAVPVTLRILKSHSEIDAAREELRRAGLSFLAPRMIQLLRKSGILKGVDVGDYIKSWDILLTARFLRDHLPPHAPVLDIGAYASEILYALNRMNFTSLTGVDLNPNLRSMPNSDTIRFVVSDFMETPFPDASFLAITAISVIEHGFRSSRLLKEVTRLLATGGYFIASFDYWPDKIDTTGIDLFGMEWKIFSRQEVLDFIEESKRHGLAPCGDVSFHSTDRVIHWGGKSYTFAWMAMKKTMP